MCDNNNVKMTCNVEQLTAIGITGFTLNISKQFLIYNKGRRNKKIKNVLQTCLQSSDPPPLPVT